MTGGTKPFGSSYEYVVLNEIKKNLEVVLISGKSFSKTEQRFLLWLLE